MKKRDEMYNSTIFFVDEFHSSNHSCGNRFKITRFEHEVAFLRSSLCEVYNNTLQVLKRSIRFMNHKRAFVYAQCFMGLRNERKRNELNRQQF